MQRVGMRSLARARGMRFDWQKLVTPLTSKGVVSGYQARDSEILQLNNEAVSVSKTVEPIDWAYWKTQIATPGVVEQMQKDYEALSFPTVDANSAENQERYAAIEAEILEAEKQKTLGASELVEVDKVISTVNKVKAEGLGWTMEQWHAFMPGLEEQHKAEYEDEDYLVPDESLKLDAVDWKAAAAEFKQGVNPELGATEEMVGDMSTSEEIGLIKDGKWSVSRLFAGKDERARIQERVDKVMSA